MHFTYRIARSRVVGVIATKLTVAPSFHWQVIVVFFYASGVFVVCVRAAGRATSCMLCDAECLA